MTLKEECLKNIEKYNKNKESILEELSKQVIKILEAGLLECSKIGKPRYCMPIEYNYTLHEIRYTDNEPNLFVAPMIASKLFKMMKPHFEEQNLKLSINSTAKLKWFKVSLDEE